MNPAALPRPEELTYRFHNFRPSDRQKIRAVANENEGEKLFVAALSLYLKKWAEADWLTEYDLERIAVWSAVHLPKSIVVAAREECERKLAGAHTEQAKKTYSVMRDALANEIDRKRPAIAAQTGAPATY